MLTSTIYEVAGVRSDAHVRALIGEIYGIEAVGGAAVELRADGDSRLIIKHKIGAPPSPDALAAAVRHAGPFTLLV